MRMSFIAALMAASALIPSIASAQDRGRWNDHADRQQGEQRQAPQQQVQQQQPRPQYQPPQQQQQFKPQPQFQAPVQQHQQMDQQFQQQRSPNGTPNSGWQGHTNGGWQHGGQVVPPTQPVPTTSDWKDHGGQDWRSRDRGQSWGGRNNDSGQNRDWRNGNNGSWHGDDHRDRDNRNWDNRGNNNRNWNNGGYDNRNWNGQQWNRDWRHDRNYDWNRYRYQNRYAYHLPRYYAPSGWGYGYQRFGIGITLNSFLYDQDYWIDDPYEYRLPQAYGPYRWVRYYNDALLVDIRSGYVVDVVNDIFW